MTVVVVFFSIAYLFVCHCVFVGLKLYARIPVPTFQFGGVTGNRETVLVFQKVASS